MAEEKAPRMLVTLMFTDERGKTEKLELGPGIYVIGRAPDCQIQVPEGCKTVSRRHAQITIGEEDVEVEDLNSRSGMMVNNEIASRQKLENDDVIAVGEITFRVLIPERGGKVEGQEVLSIRGAEGAGKATEEEFAAGLAQIGQASEKLFAEVAKRIVGQDEIVRCIWAAILAKGHCLMVGVPGLAKTLLVSTFSESMQLKFSRIQFTPDLMPSDIIGSQIIEKAADGKLQFRFEQGPIFTQLLLADEINRTPPKTQAALLQAMQEREVTVSRNTYPLRPPFCVIATQNPIEQEGTYPLPEAQQDRFMFCLNLDYPDHAQEVDILLRTTGSDSSPVSAIMSYEDILRFQQVVERIAIERELVEFTADLVRATRPGNPKQPADVKDLIDWGAGPRAGQSVIRSAKAFAAMDGRPAACSQDVLRAVKPVLRHRIGVNYRSKARNVTPDQIVDRILESLLKAGG